MSELSGLGKKEEETGVRNEMIVKRETKAEEDEGGVGVKATDNKFDSSNKKKKKVRISEDIDGKNQDDEGDSDKSNESRKEAHLAVQEELKRVQENLPQQIGSVKVLKLGSLNTSSSFQSRVNLYPVGYKAEVSVEHRESPFTPVTKEIVLCEIFEVDEMPEFVLTVQSSGKVFISSSEEGVWKKFEEKHTVDCILSFFNLSVELLLEGLPGALDCQEYLFHCQRGYGTAYITDEDAAVANSLFMPRRSRGSRTRHRQNARSTDSKLLNEVRKKQKEIEEERKKAQIKKEKEAKEKERKERERQRELDRIKKQEEKAALSAMREAKKAAKQQERMLQRKIPGSHRKQSSSSGGKREAQTDLRRARADAALQVLQVFDEEEEQEHRDQATIAVLSSRREDADNSDNIDNMKSSLVKTPLSTDSSTSLDAYIQSLPSFQEQLCVESDEDIEEILDAFNCLYSLRNFLGLSNGLTFNKFIKDILGNPMVLSQQTEENGESVTNVNEGQDAAEIDRIQLNILRTLLPDLNSLFSLDEDTDNTTSKKGAKDRDASNRARKTSFPLNQLTWTELARMLLLEFVDVELEKSEDDVLHTLRGGKLSSIKSSKNMLKSIRCRLATRHVAELYGLKSDFAKSVFSQGHEMVDVDPLDAEDCLLTYKLKPVSRSEAQEELVSNRLATENLFDFTSEAEVVAAVQEASNVSSESEHNTVDAEEYRRCCKVWLKIMSMSQAKGLLWEVDENMFPSYYSDIKRPMALVSVAYKLLQKAYSAGPQRAVTRDKALESGEVSDVASGFYRDMRQVFVNCISFNSEAVSLNGHSQKLLQCFHRHMEQWVFSAKRPPIDLCTDAFCLHSNSPLLSSRERGEYTSIKCGRCSGAFSLDALQSLELQHVELGVFQPSQEEVIQTHDDWICFLCLREDSTISTPSSSLPLALKPQYNVYAIDEWGPSALLPWHLNSNHSEQMYQFTDDMPILPNMVEATRIIACHNLTPLLLPSGQTDSSANVTLLPWTMRERLHVYAGLCELLKSHSAVHEFMSDLYKECTKLTKMSVSERFCEADFMDQVKRVAGPEGVALCRSLLDGVETDTEAISQGKVVEGRCIHCFRSTYDENVAEDDEVLLCDGCNAEAHLSCLSIDKVPSNEWYCDPCAERIASRVEGDETTLDVDSYRRHDIEAELFEELTELESKRLPNPRSSETCAYCGLSELDLCSPLVYGQSREEFNECMKDFVGNLGLSPQETSSNSTSSEVINASPSVPFLPMLRDENSSKMIQHDAKTAMVHCPVVHELCALKMYKARMQRSRHSIRRKRKVIADRIADLSYTSSRPLGHDSRGRFYWQFPNSNNSLFISPPSEESDGEADKKALSQMLEAQRLGKKDKQRRGKKGKVQSGEEMPVGEPMEAARNSSAGKGKWVRLTSVEEISRVIELLGSGTAAQPNCEVSLRDTLATLYHAEISKQLMKNSDVDNSEIKVEKIEDAVTQSSKEDDHTDIPSEQVDTSLNGEVKVEEAHQEVCADSSALNGGEDTAPEDKDAQSSATAGAENSSMFSEYEFQGEEDDGAVFGRRRPPRRAAAPVKPRLKPGEGVPVSIRLLPELGVDVLPEYVIKKEKVFEDTGFDVDSDDELDDDVTSYQKYFTFSKSSKYFAVALQDCYDVNCKLGKRFSINFQVHHEDEDDPLACTILDEPWDDGVYYFSTLKFKKSGNYTISFLAEGSKAKNISPLVIPVRVIAEHVSMGAECALDSLRAFDFITHGERHISQKRRELAAELNRTESVFSAVRSSLMAVYLALPLGSLSMGYVEEDGSKHDMTGCVVNATGWNSVLDQLWRESVLNCDNVVSLMECTLLLEFYVNKNWLVYPHSKLLSALPNPHYAMRCATCSSVALRIYCLDKALAYDRVQSIPRPSRALDLEQKEGRGGKVRRDAPEKPRKSKNSQAAKRGLERHEATALVGETPSWNAFDTIGSSRPRRAAMTRARENMAQSLRGEHEPLDEEDEGGRRSRRRGRSEGEGRAEGWTCPSCTCENSPRARSCEACGQKKSYEGSSLLRTSLSMSREERMRKRNRDEQDEERHEEEDEEDRDDGNYESESESESESSDVEEYEEKAPKRPQRSRAAQKRKRKAVSSDEEDEDDEESFASDDSWTNKKQKKSKAAASRRARAEETVPEECLVDLDSLVANRREQLEGSSGPGEEADLPLQMLQVLKSLQADPTSTPFWQPVDESYYTDYGEKVDEPMDLGTISTRVSVGFYANPEEFISDVNKVWSNCQIYNVPNSIIYENSEMLKQKFDTLVRENLLSSGRHVAATSEASDVTSDSREDNAATSIETDVTNVPMSDDSK